LIVLDGHGVVNHKTYRDYNRESVEEGRALRKVDDGKSIWRWDDFGNKRKIDDLSYSGLGEGYLNDDKEKTFGGNPEIWNNASDSDSDDEE